ncbi:MAG: 4-demethylwyosine synthase TYW1 [Candidatus Aenigmarchaeota archaeon]|nr:4-demethylwyosine synthase TYW1 [Candidatus Aenigmarchaeota archaeon]
MISQEARERFSRAGYRIVGSHSAVEVCHWTKESLRKGRVCYKEKFYGIKSHRCLEMTPALIWCTHKCKFCWRPLEFTVLGEPKPDDPKEIVESCIEARRLLLTGFKGYDKVDKKKWEEANDPTNAAISLAGEPTLYPRISELIEEFHKRSMITFLVTNGTRPDRLSSLEEEPTQLYISLCANDEKTYLEVHNPLVPDGWKKLNESLELMKSFDCRKVIRLTLVKNLNLKEPEKYAKLILKAEPNFIEAKAYMWVGESQKRLPKEAMPSMEEIRNFAKELSFHTNYEIKDEELASRVVLLTKK